MRRPRIGARRATAVLVLVASCLALVATSQPPDEAHLTATRTLNATLTADAPRAAGTLRITLSATALPFGSETIRDVSGRLRITAAGVERGTLVVGVRGTEAPVVATADPYGATIVPVEQLCPAGERCDTEVEVSVEWLGAARGAASQVSVLAELDIRYDGVVEIPVGATAQIDPVTAMAPAAPGPSVEAQTPDEQIVLDRDHWAAARHVTLIASPETLAGQTLAFLDRTVGQGAAGPRAEDSLLISIIPDGERTAPLDALTPFDPFAGCERGATCERGFTIRFELPATEASTVATVRWSFGARAAFTDDSATPVDASLAVAVDGSADATAAATALQQSLSGTFTFTREDGRFDPDGVRIEVLVPPGALPASAFGGLPPAARAVVTARGAYDAHLNVRVEPQQGRGQYAGQKLTPSTPEASILLNPLRECGIDIGCTQTVTIGVALAVPDDVNGPIEIGWELDLILVYPNLDEVPRLADLHLRLLPGGQ